MLIVNHKTIIETIIICHDHISFNQVASLNLISNYYNNLLLSYAKQINEGLSCNRIPCGVVKMCDKHDKVFCKCNEQKKWSWWCNTKLETHGHDRFLVWDSTNGWLPGLWNHIKIIQKYWIQCKPPTINL